MVPDILLLRALCNDLLLQNCAQTFKNTTQNSPKHAISSEKFLFSAIPRHLRRCTHSWPQTSLLDLPLRPSAEF